ncbi:MAG: bleomycin resistance family protein [Acidobacteria bacterium]|nr:bleomycin resistance family protein [Acidobacteriota bacterium]
MVNSFGAPAPIFRVRHLGASLAYYTERLGFSHDWGDAGLASVSRDHCTIFLTEWDQGCNGTRAWIGVDDAGTLHEELVRRGARVRFPPTNYQWAFEMQVEDLDGNVLRLGSHPKDGVPYGEFLDAAGVRWSMAARDA